MNIAMFSDTYAPQVNGGDDDKDARRESQKGGATSISSRSITRRPRSQGKRVSGTLSEFPWEKQHRIGLPTNYRELIQIITNLKIDLIHSHTSIIVGYLANLVTSKLGLLWCHDLPHHDGELRSLHPLHGTHSEGIYKKAG